MSRILIYVFPALMDMVVSSAVFICSVRAAQAKLSDSKVAGLIAVWSLAYMIACPLVGRLVTERNAARILIWASIATAGMCLLFLVFTSIGMMYVLVGFTAFAVGFFFVPFQVFMKQVDRGGSKSIPYSTGLYTFSWSIGLSTGPLVAGVLWKKGGWEACFGIDAVAALAAAVGICLLRHHAHAAKPAPVTTQQGGAREAIDYSRMPNLAWMAWVCGGIGALTFALYRGIFPNTGELLKLTPSVQGTVFFIQCVVQALVGLFLVRSRFWMYKPLPLVAFGACGIAALELFAMGTTAPTFYLAAALYGIYSGTFFFYLVFHALVHPVQSARYVSINESVIGVTGVLGPVMGGLLADRSGQPASYLLGAAFVLTAVGIQAVVHSRHAASVEPLAVNRAENVPA